MVLAESQPPAPAAGAHLGGRQYRITLMNVFIKVIPTDTFCLVGGGVVFEFVIVGFIDWSHSVFDQAISP